MADSLRVALPIVGVVGPPVIVGVGVGLATGFFGTDLITDILDGVSNSVKQNRAILGVTTGVVAMGATAVVLNYDKLQGLIQ